MHYPIARIRFAPLRHRTRGLITHGTCTGRTIRLDPRGPVGMTLIHEYLHLMYPSWSETKVKREERRRWKRMGWREKAKLYQQLGKARIEDEEDEG